jgi:hypothetical protein
VPGAATATVVVPAGFAIAAVDDGPAVEAPRLGHGKHTLIVREVAA